MSTNNTYLQMSLSDMKIADLLQKINSVLGEGLASMQLTGNLTFAPDGALTTGALQFNGNNIQFSVDGGQTWSNVTNNDYAWHSGTTYSPGSVVLYDGAWYSCVTSTQGTPGAVAAWRLLTIGSSVYYVDTLDKLNQALATAGSCTIYITGAIVGNVSATVTAPVMIIYSDERASITASSITLTASSGVKIYWHCRGTSFVADDSSLALTMGAGTLYLGNVKAQGTLALTGDVRYQQVTGTVTGGTQETWLDMDQSTTRVPLDLSTLSSSAYSDNAALYVYDNGSGGFITARALCDNVAALTAKYWKIESQGTLDRLPVTAPEGFLYFATDTGDLYRYGSDGWDSGIHIQGPAGSSGASGSAGSDGVSPGVAITSIAGGTMVVITDAQHPSGQSFNVMNGSNGSDGLTPVFSVGTVQTLEPNQSATVAITGTAPNFGINFGIPRGSDGSGGEGGSATWGDITGTLSNQTDLANALGAKQDVIDASHKLDYDLISNTPTIPTVNNASVTIYQNNVSKGGFTLNQAGAASVYLDVGLTSVTWGGITGTLANQTDLNTALGSKQNVIDASHKLDYGLLSSTPTIGSGVVTITQGGVSKGQINVNTTGNSTIELEAGGAAVRPIVSSATAALDVSLDNVYDWTVPMSSAGTMTLTSRPEGYEGYVTAMIRLGAAATVTFTSMTVIDPLAGDCLNYCGVHWDGNTARVYVYDRAPEITILQDTISITGVPNTAITSVDLTSSVSVGAGVTPTFTASSLPSGITLTSAGVLSGTPTAQYVGSSTVAVRATGAESKTMTLAFSIMPPQPKMVVTARSTETALIGDYVLQSGSSSGTDSVWYNSGIGKYLYTFTGTWCVASSTDTALGLADAIIDTRMPPNEWSSVADTNYYYSFTYTAP